MKKPRGRELSALEELYNTKINSQRQIVERALSRIKRYRAVSKFRHDISKHRITFHACAQLACIDIKLRPLRNYIPKQFFDFRFNEINNH
jgi:hypothetical protein